MNDSCSILIVDDDPSLCTSLRDILEMHGSHEVEVASCGKDALTASGERSFDVVLLDMKLPDMTGLELVPQLEVILPKASFLVITGYASQDTATEAVRPSTVAYLTKPIDIERLLAIIDGIAERKRLERENERLLESLRLEKQQWESTFDAISDPIAISDSKGFIQRVNLAFSEVFKISAEHAVGSQDHTLFFGREPRSYTELLGRQPLPRREERDDLAVEGVFEVSCDSVELSDGTGVIYVLRDITEKKQAAEALRRREAELFQAQKMEAVGRLAGGIAHDFNNLLTVILADTDIALSKMDLGDSLRSRLVRINRAAERSSVLSSKLLGFGQVVKIQPQSCDFNTILRDAEGMLRRLVREKIRLRTVLAPDLGRVMADPVQLERVIVNLVSNARDAMPDGGMLTIETSNGYPGASHNGDFFESSSAPCIVLSVRDTGPGIDPEIQDKIFEPFFTTKKKGAGLGLSMVQGIVEQSDGRVRAENGRGRGCTFYVSWPRADVESVPPPQKTRVPELTRQATVLLADDSDPVRELVAEALALDGYKVLSAEDGEKAHSIATEWEGPIDLLITDVLMPRLNGPELAERMALTFPTTPVLFISGFPDQELPEQAEYLQKPFTVQKFLLKVRELLTESRQIPLA